MRAKAKIASILLLPFVLCLETRADPVQTMSSARARIYARTSREVWATALRVASDLHLSLDRDPEHQLLATWWQPFLPSPGQGLKILPLGEYPRAEKLQLHLFVSPFAEPARLYVDAIVMTGLYQGAKHVNLRYAAEDVSAWFFARLEDRLGERGRPIPTDWAARLLLGQELTAAAPCQPPSDSKGAWTEPVQPPRPISRPQPYYASVDLEKGREAVINVEVSLGEDGAVHAVHTPPPSGAEGIMAEQAAKAAMLWRFEPARAARCAVPSIVTVPVRFKTR